MRTDALELEVPFEFLPHQWDLLEYEPTKGRGPTIEALLGWWGSGKTAGVAGKFFRRCLQNPWTEKYGEKRPQAAVLAPTARVLEKATVGTLREIIPSAMIKKEWKRPMPRWLLANDVEVSFVSGDAEFEGENLFAIWVDEIHHPIFSRNPNKFRNYLSRLRDPHSTVLSLLCSGLPEAGWTRDTFDLERLTAAQCENRYTRLCGSNDNPHLPEELIQAILTMVPQGMETAVKSGGWMLPPGAIFRGYDQGLHVISNDAEDNNAPVHIGMDVGVHSSAVLAQDRPATITGVTGQQERGKGVLIVDEVVGEGLSVKDLCMQIRMLPSAQRIIPGRSEIYVDPTIRTDELDVIYSSFAGCHVVVRKRTDEFYNIWPGIRVMQASLRDGLKNTRLWFCQRLQLNKNGILDAMVGSRVSERTGQLVKDDSTDHARDAARYVIQGRLGSLGGFDPM